MEMLIKVRLPLDAALIFLALTVVPSAVPASTGDPATEFLKDAPAAWQLWMQRVPLYQGTYTSRYSSTLTNISAELKVARKSNEFCRLLASSETEYENEKVTTLPEEVTAYNSRYAFILQKKGEHYICKHVEFKGEHGFSQRILDKFLIDDKLVVMRPCLIDNKPFLELLREPYFQVTNAEICHKDGERLIKIDFVCPHDSESDKAPFWNVAQSGTVFLDPSRHWLIRNSELNIAHRGTGGVYTGRFLKQFKPTGQGPRNQLVGVVEGYEHIDLPDGRTNIRRSVLDLNLSIPDSLPSESDFTLSAFGLPEPPGVTWERPTPWWLYGILLGFALVILSGILYKVVGRWRTPAAKPQTR